VVAVIASTSINEVEAKASGSGNSIAAPPTPPPPMVTPEPTMLPVLAGLGAAIAVGAKLRRREKPEGKAGSETDSGLPES
jgi:hypothetical protein